MSKVGWLFRRQFKVNKQVVRCHKIRLRPTPVQEVLFWKSVGTARFAFNWALSQWKSQYELGGKPSEVALRRQLNSVKKAEFPWMAEVPKGVVQQSIKNLGVSYVNFFKKRAKFPKFKSRHTSRQAARLDNGPGTFAFDGKRVRVPVIGWIRTFEKMRWLEGRPLSAVLRREGERWFLSVAVEIEISDRRGDENQVVSEVGIDLGITSAITASDGAKFVSPRPLKGLLSKLERWQRKLSRASKGGKNRSKLKARVARLHWRIAQIRYDWQHKVTSSLAATYGRVYTEDLNVSGMVRNHCLARSISDVGLGELVRQLSYKTEVIKVSRWFASSKTCSCCGHVVETLPLNVRTWKCEKCNAVHDRDINAAYNILVEGRKVLAASCAVSACGDERSGLGPVAQTKRSSVKQESRKYHLIPN